MIELVDNIEVDLERVLKSKSIILASQPNISETNVKLNEVSMEEYFETQEQDIVSGSIDTIYQHFHYFTKKSLFQMFEQHGKVLETLVVPGTNSMFVCLD